MARFQSSTFSNDSIKFGNLEHKSGHDWVTVVNPINRRSLLQACDNCGVVKSENSMLRKCQAPAGLGLVSSALLSSNLTARIAS